MTKVVIEVLGEIGDGRDTGVRVVDLKQLITAGRALACPTCSSLQFTAEVGTTGDLVLFCWREPTHLRIIMPQRLEVKGNALCRWYLAAIWRLVGHTSNRASN